MTPTMRSEFHAGQNRKPSTRTRICIAIPYFGEWPEWMELFLESCRVNPTIDWMFFSDCGIPTSGLPSNVTVESMQLTQFLSMSKANIGIQIKWENAYKICDLRPAFGVIFEKHFESYDFWGWGDIDVIYGNMRSFLSEEIMSHDCISFSTNRLSGHLCLWRNDKEVRNWFRSIPDWRDRMENPDSTHLDEPHPSVVPEALRVYAEYSFSTPLSPINPWTDGTFNFPAEWYWKEGSLTNDIDGNREFLYLHFMQWKGGWWPRRCGNAQWEKLGKLVNLEPGEAKRGFQINERGFFPLAR